ncbi:hypothetical protein [uncultured Sphingomonas sp.]|uniref:hypothetical protein n=1 Tax=uncultured Sphingomonas sp. TaxID=158754 RepID=UPI0025E74532|nr:hypothetical protein [uncultured Sphingomonas sp.]
MKFVWKFAVHMTGVIITAILWKNFGLLGVLVAMPVAFVAGWYAPAIKQRWRISD